MYIYYKLNQNKQKCNKRGTCHKYNRLSSAEQDPISLGVRAKLFRIHNGQF